MLTLEIVEKYLNDNGVTTWRMRGPADLGPDGNPYAAWSRKFEKWDDAEMLEELLKSVNGLVFVGLYAIAYETHRTFKDEFVGACIIRYSGRIKEV